jgi:protease II
MKPLTIFSLFFFLYIAGKSSSIKAQLPDLPLAKKVPVTTEYIGGNLVTDNYRWLENMKDTAVDSWFKSQASCFDKLMNQIPARDDLYNWLFKVDSLKKENIRSIVRKRKRFFYIKTAIGENVGKLAFRDGEYGQEEILFEA